MIVPPIIVGNQSRQYGPVKLSPAVVPTGLHLDPGPTPYLLCGHKQMTSSRIASELLHWQVKKVTLRVVLGTCQALILSWH